MCNALAVAISGAMSWRHMAAWASSKPSLLYAEQLSLAELSNDLALLQVAVLSAVSSWRRPLQGS